MNAGAEKALVWARLQLTYKISPHPVLEHLQVESEGAAFKDAAGWVWRLDQVLAPVLLFQMAQLKTNGFVAVKHLTELKKKTGVHWGIFGTFRNQGEARCNLVLPSSYAKDYNLIVSNWEIKEWLKTMI